MVFIGSVIDSKLGWHNFSSLHRPSFLFLLHSHANQGFLWILPIIYPGNVFIFINYFYIIFILNDVKVLSLIYL